MKFKPLILTCVLASSLSLFSCSTNPNNDGKTHIICSIFPIYDWVSNIVGDNDDIVVDLLLKNGSDPHSYQPSVADVASINKSSYFIYNGGESDSWAKDIIKQTPKSLNAISLFDVLTESRLLPVDSVSEEDHDHDKHEEFDEHIWLSLRNASFIVSSLAKTLSDHFIIDSELVDSYISELETLDSKYIEVTNSEDTTDKLVIADRYALRYLSHDYNLTCFAAFDSCSAETEASFQTIVGLAKRIDENNLQSVIILESSSDKLAKTIISNTSTKNQEIHVFNSLQSVTESQIKKGLSYVSVMASNLEVLKEAIAK